MASGVAGSSLNYEDLFFGPLYPALVADLRSRIAKQQPEVDEALSALGSYQKRVAVEQRSGVKKQEVRDQLVQEYWLRSRQILRAVEIGGYVHHVSTLLVNSRQEIPEQDTALQETVRKINQAVKDLMVEVKGWEDDLSTCIGKMRAHLQSATPVLDGYCKQFADTGKGWLPWSSSSSIPHTEGPIPAPLNFEKPHLLSYQAVEDRVHIEASMVDQLLNDVGDFSTRIERRNSDVQHQKASADLEGLPRFCLEAQQEYQSLVARAAVIKEFTRRAVVCMNFITPPVLECPGEVQVPNFSFAKASDSVCAEHTKRLQPLLERMRVSSSEVDELLGIAEGHVHRTVALKANGGPLTLAGRAWSNLTQVVWGSQAGVSEQPTASVPVLAPPSRAQDVEEEPASSAPEAAPPPTTMRRRNKGVQPAVADRT